MMSGTLLGKLLFGGYGLGLTLLALFAGHAFGQEAEASLAAGTTAGISMVRDCTSAHERLAPARVVLQVIEDRFHKWREYELGSGEFCIVMEEPRFGALSQQQATVLLEASAGWMEAETVPQWTEVLDADDPSLNVPPAMPARPYDPDRPETESGAPDTPAEDFFAAVDDSASSGTRDNSPTVVIGTDDRVRITGTDAFPWRTVAFQTHSYSNNSTFRCTAFLVAPHVAMSNGHCTYDSDLGGWATSYSIAPGQRQDTDGGSVIRPYGLWSAASWTTNQQYIDTGEAQHDYAISRYTASFSNVFNSTYMPLVFEISPPVGDLINVAGYPSVAHGANTSALWFSSGAVHSISGRVLRYLADTSGGNSGGPVWQFFSADNSRRVIAVHAFGNATAGYNGGPRLVSQNQTLIEGWMQFGLPSRGLSVTRHGTGTGTVQSTITPGGISCGSICSASFANNSSVTLTRSAATGSTFAGWGGGCSGTAATCTVTMSAARSVTATFNLNSYALSVTRGGTGSGTVTSSPSGINCGATCSANFDHGTSVTLTAAPATGSTFTGWSGACSGTATTCIVSMTQARSVTANFTINVYALSVTKNGTGSGTVTSSPRGINCGEACTANFSHGTSVILTAAPTIGSAFTGWSGACSGLSGTCAVSMTQARKVNASFEVKEDELFIDRFEIE